MSTENPSTIDLNNSRIELRDDLVFAPRRSSGKTIVHIECKRESKFFRIGYPEYVFISALDGQNTFAQAQAITSQELGVDALTTEEATDLYFWLIRNKLGTLSDATIDSKIGQEKNLAQASLNRLNPFWLKIPFGCPKNIVDQLTTSIGWMFSTAVTFAGIIVIVLALVCGFCNWDHLQTFTTGIFAPSNWLLMLVSWIALKLIHEASHAITAKRYGADLSDCGVVMILFAPMAYVDLSSAWRLPSKWQRIHIALSGIYAELLVSAGATFAMLYCDSIVIGQALFNLLIMAGLSTVLFNANPLMRFDGYYALSDLLDIPNLYQEGDKELKRWLRKIFFGPWFKGPESPRRFGPSKGRLLFVSIYGWLTAFWKIVICVSLAITASVLWNGAGVILSAFGILMWFGPSARKLTSELNRRWKMKPTSLLRPGLTSMAFFALIWSILQLSPAPFGVTVPAVVEYSNVVHVRSLSPSFIQEIHVTNGQHVNAGELLLVLRNDEVKRKFDDLSLQIKQTQLRHSMAIEDGDIAEAQIEQSNLKSLEKRLAEAGRLYHGLMVRAPKSGMVVCRSLEDQKGNFVSEGSTLLSIGNENRKELVISLADHDFDRVASSVGDQVQIIDGLFRSNEGKFLRLQPRASKNLSYSSLAVTEGGPLPVVQTSYKKESEFELVEPRFQGTVAIKEDCCHNFYSGQRVTVKITNGVDNLGSWVVRSVRHWIDQKFQEAS